jgi:tRNA1Val (adenine37-N6)-methyltransferase
LRIHHAAAQGFVAAEGFDLIVSNPPWFEDSLKSPDSARNQARHNDTLSTSCLIDSLRRLLRDQGHCCLVLPNSCAAKFCEVAAAHGLFCERRCSIHPTPASDCRRQLLSLTAERCEVFVQQQLIVELSRHNYSPEFRSLAQDFLLKL